MILINYSPGEEHIIDAEAMGIGGAMCGRGVEAILFDRHDMELMSSMLNSESEVERERIADYLSTLCTRFSARNPTHKAILDN